MRTIAILSAAAMLSALSMSAHAEQITFMRGENQVWDYPSSDGSVPIVERPANNNWLSPIDYAHGTMYLRYECTSKPTSYNIGVQLCFWMPGWTPETCAPAFHYTTTGVYYVKWEKPAGWWSIGSYPWGANNFSHARFFQKDGNNMWNMMAESQCGNYCFTGNAYDHIPITYNAELICVSPGETLDPPANWDCPPEWECGGATRVIISPKGGSFVDAVTVTLETSEPGAEIRYTLDGADPTGSSELYNEPFEITQTTTVKAAQFSAGSIAGPVASAEFTKLQPRQPDNPGEVVNGVQYEYYEGDFSALPDFDGLAPKKTGTEISFSITQRDRDDGFAFRFKGYIDIAAAGMYTFYTTSDDGSALYIGDQQVVSNDGMHAAIEKSGEIALAKGIHEITVTFFDKDGGEELAVEYAEPNGTKTGIPASQLYCINSGNAVDVFRNKALAAKQIITLYGTGHVKVADEIAEEHFEITALNGTCIAKNLKAQNGRLALPVAAMSPGLYLLRLHRQNSIALCRILVP